MSTIPDFTASQLGFIRRAQDVDIQRQHALEQIEELSGERTERLQSLKDAQESMREASKYPNESINLAGLIDDWVARAEEFADIDRRTSSAKKTANKLEARSLALLRASRLEDPELFEARGVVIADLLGDDALCKPLTENGYDTVDGYLAARTQMIAQLTSAGTIPESLIEQADAAVYRYLDSKDLLDRWPLDKTPGGQQMRLGASEDDETTEPSNEDATPGQQLRDKLDHHFEEEQPLWATCSLTTLITTVARDNKAGEDIVEAVTNWTQARDESLPDDETYTAIHLLVDLAVEAVDFKPRGKQKLKISAEKVPDQLLAVFAEIERQHKEEPLPLYQEVAEILGGLKASIRGRIDFARALR